MNAHRFDEWPLVVFTTLAVMGAGLLTAPLVAAIVGPSAAAASPVLLAGAALLAAGLIVSLAHLGQPQRSPLALARAGRSRLSNEIALASATLAAGILAAVFPFLSPITTLLPSMCAVAFLVSLGLVYALPGQLAWRGAVVATPLTLGLGFGALAQASAWDGAAWDVAPIAAIALAADVGLFVFRRKAGALRHTGLPMAANTDLLMAAHTDLLRATHTGLPMATHTGLPMAAHTGLLMVAHTGLLMAARFVLVDILPGCLLVAGLPKGAAGMLGLGILVDRLSFYLRAAQHTTEAEIARVEDAIAGGPRSC